MRVTAIGEDWGMGVVSRHPAGSQVEARRVPCSHSLAKAQTQSRHESLSEPPCVRTCCDTASKPLAPSR